MEKPHPQRWVEQLAFDRQFAAKALVRNGELRPMFVLHKGDSIVPLETPFRSPEHKESVFTFIALSLLAARAEGFSYIAEAWIRSVAVTPGESAAQFRTRARSVAPDQASDRREIVLVAVVYRDSDGVRRSLSAFDEIERGPDAQPIGLKPCPSGALEGNILELMPEAAPSAANCGHAAHVMNTIGAQIMRDLGIKELKRAP